ncbi:DUF4149 domain-containing protein, partial [bacterium]|nr:DUF4149 domain-containing protein [bacterium]
MLTVLCDICLLVPLTIWVGGITVLLFLIAPTIFRYLPNRTQSGNLVGMIFHHLEILHFGVIGLLILSETLKFVSTGSLISYKEMFISCLLGCFLVILLLAFTFINHKIQSVRAQIVSFDAMDK